MNADTGTHPITALVDQAAENIRQANHATIGDTREAAELYSTVGALTTLLQRLPQLMDHLQLIIGDADPDSYFDAFDGSNGDYLLQIAQICLIDGMRHTAEATEFVNFAWSYLGRLLPRDIELD